MHVPLFFCTTLYIVAERLAVLEGRRCGHGHLHLQEAAVWVGEGKDPERATCTRAGRRGGRMSDIRTPGHLPPPEITIADICPLYMTLNRKS